jgi:cytosol alanyl aminopeptidase
MRIWTPVWMALALTGLTACEPAREDAATDVEAAAALPMPTGRLGDAVAPTHYRLDLTILPGEETFRGRVEIDVDIREPSPVIWLHGNRLSVREVTLSASGSRLAADYEQVDATGVARVTLEATPPAGPATLTFDYEAPFDQALEGLYSVREGEEDYAFTQFQATSARLAFPGFDEPAFKTPFDITLTVRADEVAITTTPEVATEPAGDGLVRRTYATTRPLPTYLIAFAVGPLDMVDYGELPPNEIRARPLPLRGFAAKGKGPLLEYALANTQGILEVLERYFGSPYPYEKLDIVAAPDFAAGAMENVGLITYREQLLLLDDNASMAQRRAYASVHAHELAHQWVGNLVTPRWWNDLWLNESFATWMGNKTVHAWRPDFGYGNQSFLGALQTMHADALTSARQIREPIRSNHDIATAFDSITYRKGGGVLAMFESWLGEAAFRDGVRLHLERFADAVADADDFMNSLAEGAGDTAVVPAFRSFLEQPGVPLVSASMSCEDSVRVTLSQERYLPLGSTGDRGRVWRVPVCMAYDAGNGRERHCALLSEARATVEMPTACPAWLMPNDDGAGYYRFDLDATGWDALIEHADALNEREAQAMLGSLGAAFRAGRTDVATLVSALRVLAAADDREVATAPLEHLDLLRERLAGDAAVRRSVESLVRELYQTRAEALGLAARAGDDVETALLRSAVVAAVADLGRDAELRAALANRAAAWLDAEAPDPELLDPGLVEVAFKVAVEDAGGAFAERLLERALDSREATFRQRAFQALAVSPDPALGATVRGLLLDARLRDNEAVVIAFAQANVEPQRDALWAWAQDNLDALLARIPTWRKGSVVGVGGGYCSAERADELEAFFADRVSDLEGGPRALAQAVETMRQCDALVQARAGEVAAYFADAAPSRR